MKFKMICTGGPFGDCTCNYDVKLEGKCTVREFVKSVLKEKPGEWGSFEMVEDLKRPFLTQIDACKYKYGEITERFEKRENEGLEVGEIKANGGWTEMTYYIKAKQEGKGEKESVCA